MTSLSAIFLSYSDEHPMMLLRQSSMQRRLSIALAAAASLALAATSATSAVAMEPHPSCIGDRCFPADFLGGLGLKPKRQYVALYGTDKLCHQALKEINSAILAGEKSLKAVLRPLPASARTAQPIWNNESTTEYETRNPIFAGDIFLPWNFLNADPGPYLPGTEPTEEQQKHDQDRARWLIAPIFNDGKPLLLTQVPTAGVTVWDVPADQLDKHDWSDWHSYRAFKPEETTCVFDPSRPASPFSGFMSWCPDHNGNYGSQYPNLKADTRKPAYSPPDRVISLAVFAFYAGRYYVVLQTPNQDMISITDSGSGLPSRDDYGISRANADLCYFVPVKLDR